MSTQHPEPAEHFIEDGLTASYAALVTDLATTLDIDAGVTDATHPATYTALSTDLATALDLDTGLAAVIGPTTSSPPHHDRASSSFATPPRRSVVDYLRSLSHVQRLALRTRPAYLTMRCATELTISIHSALDRADALINALDGAYVDGFALFLDLDRALKHAHARARDLAGALDAIGGPGIGLVDVHAANNEFAHARNHAQALDEALVLVFDRRRSHAHTRALNRARAHARSLHRSLRSILPLALALARARTADFTIRLNLDLDLELTSGGYRQHDAENTRRLLTGWGVLLAEVGDDFVGADLRSADRVAPGDLTGVRWSLTTTWPPSWEERVRRASVEIEPEIFEVREDGWTESPSEVST
jgi:hypothetical protein